MISKLLSFLSAPADTPSDDARLPLAALLVRLARTDGEYAPEEKKRIDAILSKRYGLEPAGASELRAQGESLEQSAPDTVRFTRAIKDEVEYEERETIVGVLWEVVLADGVRDEQEDAMIRLVANLLGVNDRDSALIRQRISRKLGSA
jgi:uncharacterized tellurite resistance protein B-like protein